MGHDRRTRTADQHGPDEHLHHRHGGHAEDLAHHQFEGSHRRDHDLQHARRLLLDDALHHHGAVDHQEHVEHHAEPQPHHCGDGRRTGRRRTLVVADDLHLDVGLDVGQNPVEIFDPVSAQLLAFEHFRDLAPQILFEHHRRSGIGVELHVGGVRQYVGADIEHAELVDHHAQRRIDRQVRRFEAHLVAAFEMLRHQSAAVDHDDGLGLARSVAHHQRRRQHQAEHQHGHEQRGDDEGFFADALVELARHDQPYIRHEK